VEDSVTKLVLLPERIRIKSISWDVWVFFVLFVWIGVFHVLFAPTVVKKQILLQWLPEVIKKSPEAILLGKDLEGAISMSSTLTFTLLDISMRAFAWWFATYAVLKYAFSGRGIQAVLVPFKDKKMIVADSLKVYRKMILSATMLASMLYLLKDYVIYMLLVRKGIDPVSAGWVFIINLGGIISMVVVTIIWVLLPDAWLNKMWLVRAATDECSWRYIY